MAIINTYPNLNRARDSDRIVFTVSSARADAPKGVFSIEFSKFKGILGVGGLAQGASFPDSPADNDLFLLNTALTNFEVGLYRYSTGSSQWIIVLKNQSGIESGTTLPSGANEGDAFLLTEKENSNEIGLYLRGSSSWNLILGQSLPITNTAFDLSNDNDDSDEEGATRKVIKEGLLSVSDEVDNVNPIAKLGNTDRWPINKVTLPDTENFFEDDYSWGNGDFDLTSVVLNSASPSWTSPKFSPDLFSQGIKHNLNWNVSFSFCMVAESVTNTAQLKVDFIFSGNESIDPITVSRTVNLPFPEDDDWPEVNLRQEEKLGKKNIATHNKFQIKLTWLSGADISFDKFASDGLSSTEINVSLEPYSGIGKNLELLEQLGGSTSLNTFIPDVADSPSIKSGFRLSRSFTGDGAPVSGKGRFQIYSYKYQGELGSYDGAVQQFLKFLGERGYYSRYEEAGDGSGEAGSLDPPTEFTGGWDFVEGEDISFLNLTDTPASFSGQAGKLAQVNSAENALEFIDSGEGGNDKRLDAGFVYSPERRVDSLNLRVEAIQDQTDKFNLVDPVTSEVIFLVQPDTYRVQGITRFGTGFTIKSLLARGLSTTLTTTTIAIITLISAESTTQAFYQTVTNLNAPIEVTLIFRDRLIITALRNLDGESIELKATLGNGNIYNFIDAPEPAKLIGKDELDLKEVNPDNFPDSLNSEVLRNELEAGFVYDPTTAGSHYFGHVIKASGTERFLVENPEDSPTDRQFIVNLNGGNTAIFIFESDIHQELPNVVGTGTPTQPSKFHFTNYRTGKVLTYERTGSFQFTIPGRPFTILGGRELYDNMVAGSFWRLAIEYPDGSFYQFHSGTQPAQLIGRAALNLKRVAPSNFPDQLQELSSDKYNDSSSLSAADKMFVELQPGEPKPFFEVDGVRITDSPQRFGATKEIVGFSEPKGEIYGDNTSMVLAVYDEFSSKAELEHDTELINHSSNETQSVPANFWHQVGVKTKELKAGEVYIFNIAIKFDIGNFDLSFVHKKQEQQIWQSYKDYYFQHRTNQNPSFLNVRVPFKAPSDGTYNFAIQFLNRSSAEHALGQVTFSNLIEHHTTGSRLQLFGFKDVVNIEKLYNNIQRVDFGLENRNEKFPLDIDDLRSGELLILKANFVKYNNLSSEHTGQFGAIENSDYFYWQYRKKGETTWKNTINHGTGDDIRDIDSIVSSGGKTYLTGPSSQSIISYVKIDDTEGLETITPGDYQFRPRMVYCNATSKYHDGTIGHILNPVFSLETSESSHKEVSTGYRVGTTPSAIITQLEPDNIYSIFSPESPGPIEITGTVEVPHTLDLTDVADDDEIKISAFVPFDLRDDEILKIEYMWSALDNDGNQTAWTKADQTTIVQYQGQECLYFESLMAPPVASPINDYKVAIGFSITGTTTVNREGRTYLLAQKLSSSVLKYKKTLVVTDTDNPTISTEASLKISINGGAEEELDSKTVLSDRVVFQASEERLGHNLKVGELSSVAVRKKHDDQLIVFSHIEEKTLSDISVKDLQKNVFPDRVVDLPLNIWEPKLESATLAPSRKNVAELVAQQQQFRKEEEGSFNERIDDLEGAEFIRQDNFLGATLTGDNSSTFIDGLGGGWHQAFNNVPAKGTATNARIHSSVIFVGHQFIYLLADRGTTLDVFANGDAFTYNQISSQVYQSTIYYRYERDGDYAPRKLITGAKWENVHIEVASSGFVLLQSDRKFLTSFQKENVEKLQGIYIEKRPAPYTDVRQAITISSFSKVALNTNIPATGFFAQAKHKGWLVRVYQNGHVWASRDGRLYYSFGEVPFRFQARDFALESTGTYLVLSGGRPVGNEALVYFQIYRTEDLRSWETLNTSGDLFFDAARGHKMVYLEDNKTLYSLGGHQADGEVISNMSSTANDGLTWKTEAPPFQATEAREGFAVLVKPGSFVIYGGKRGTTYFGDALEYTPGSGWAAFETRDTSLDSAALNLPDTDGSTIVKDPNGFYYLFGGNTASATLNKRAYISYHGGSAWKRVFNFSYPARNNANINEFLGNFYLTGGTDGTTSLFHDQWVAETTLKLREVFVTDPHYDLSQSITIRNLEARIKALENA